MAKQQGIFPFTGKLGNVIGYYANGQYITRSAPGEVRQTQATRYASKDFGNASKAAATLRHAIAREIDLRHDSSFTNRLNKAMGEVLRADWQHRAGKRVVQTGNLQKLSGLRINRNCILKTDVLVQRTFDGSIAVTVVDPTGQFPAKVQHMQFRAIAICPDFALGLSKTIASESIMVQKHDDLGELVFNIPVKPGQTAIVIVEAIAYSMTMGRLSRMQYKIYNAADVVAVVPAVKKVAAGKDYSSAPMLYEHAPFPLTGIFSAESPG
ncbi:hypothetical protein [uncultured Chitinophaga sp.]|uniref:hypothetical protein n=1 Tax=uncultured Chitinophaga sp. TaxID=339340 RepID=UPI0025F158F9|nr:hypothetical protein [uncultured Chitinophaga sp.]